MLEWPVQEEAKMQQDAFTDGVSPGGAIWCNGRAGVGIGEYDVDQDELAFGVIVVLEWVPPDYSLVLTMPEWAYILPACTNGGCGTG